MKGICLLAEQIELASGIDCLPFGRNVYLLSGWRVCSVWFSVFLLNG